MKFLEYATPSIYLFKDNYLLLKLVIINNSFSNLTKSIIIESKLVKSNGFTFKSGQVPILSFKTSQVQSIFNDKTGNLSEKITKNWYANWTFEDNHNYYFFLQFWKSICCVLVFLVLFKRVKNALDHFWI